MADLKSVDAVADPDTPEAAADPDRPEAAFASTDPAADPEPTEAVADPQQVSASPNAVEGTDEKENAAPLLHNVSPNMVAAFDALSLEQVHELEAVAACRFGTWLQTAEDLEREAEFGGYEEVVGSYHTVNDPRFEVVDWTRLGPVTDTENEVYVVPNVLGPEQCDAILAAVSARAKKRGGWQVDRHEYFPTTDMRCAEACADAPAMEQMVRAAVFEKICEPLASHWAGSRFLAEHLVFRDFFFVHYSAAEGEQRGLNMHADGSLFSFNVLLTDPAEFEGGGTFFSLPYAPHGHGKTVSVPRSGRVRAVCAIELDMQSRSEWESTSAQLRTLAS